MGKLGGLPFQGHFKRTLQAVSNKWRLCPVEKNTSKLEMMMITKAESTCTQMFLKTLLFFYAFGPFVYKPTPF